MRARISLRSLLLLVVILAMCLAPIGAFYREHLRQKRIVNQLGATTVSYSRFGQVNGILLTCNEDIESQLRLVNKLPNLKYLHIVSPELSNEDLQYLDNLKQVREMTIVSRKLGDKGIQHLASLSALETLRIHESQVTSRGLAKLQKALPMCTLSATNVETRGSQKWERTKYADGTEELEPYY